MTLAGDIHTYFVADVKEDDLSQQAPVLMSEFVGTSITSDCYNPGLFASQMTDNPSIKFCDGWRRGYAICDVTKDVWRTDLRAVEDVRVRDSTISTLKSFVVENGKPGPQAA